MIWALSPSIIAAAYLLYKYVDDRFLKLEEQIIDLRQRLLPLD